MRIFNAISNLSYYYFACGLALCLFACRTPAKLAERYPEGYVISLKGDTTKGFLKSNTPVKDQIAVEFFDYFGAKTNYKVGRIRGFGFDNQHFLARPVPEVISSTYTDSMMFMRRMVDGPAQLYRFFLGNLSRGPGYFDILVKPDQSEYNINYNFGWKRLANAISDYSALADSVKADQFDLEETPIIIRHYNSWYLQQFQTEKKR